jgi:opacity protein-like surface antigen
MRRIRRNVVKAVVLSVLVAMPSSAQAPVNQLSTRFSFGAAPLMSQPKEEFRANVGRGFGAGGALLYRLDRTGVLSLRFDASGVEYGREKKRVPFSESVGGRVLLDARTTNSIMAVSLGPEIALPRGFVRPYVNTAFSGLLFSTRSSVSGISAPDGDIASTTNHRDWTRAWVVGGGVRIPFVGKLSNLSLDLGVRYHRGGQASYLREGSIQDNPDGSISITPLTSRTPYMGYLIGFQYRIPFNSTNPCPRFLC